jgi:acyl carrier protein
MVETIGRLTEIFRDVFDDDELEIARTTSAKDVENWDSLSHVTLIVQIEKAFGVRFTSAEVANLQNVGELIDLIERKAGK